MIAVARGRGEEDSKWILTQYIKGPKEMAKGASTRAASFTKFATEKEVSDTPPCLVGGACLLVLVLLSLPWKQ